METEKQDHFPFLDISLHNTSNSIITSVYRKPTHTDQYIHYLSNHHPQIKRAIVATLTRRAKSICSPEHHRDEIQHLKQTFTVLNNYPRHLVDQTIATTLKQQDPQTPKPEPSPIRVTIPYQGLISHHISRLLKKTVSIDVTFFSDKTLKTILPANGKGPASQATPNPRGCVYQLKCDCGHTYIGETSRPVEIRLKGHKTSIQKVHMKSALSEHVINNPNHTINWQQTKFLSTNVHNWKKRKLLEAVYINRENPSINRDQGVFLPSAWSIKSYSQSAIC